MSRRTTRVADRLPIVKRTKLGAKRGSKKAAPGDLVPRSLSALARSKLTYAVLSKERFYQGQVDGDCSICTVNNLLRSEVLTVDSMNKAQEQLRLLYRKRNDYNTADTLVCTCVLANLTCSER